MLCLSGATTPVTLALWPPPVRRQDLWIDLRRRGFRRHLRLYSTPAPSAEADCASGHREQKTNHISSSIASLALPPHRHIRLPARLPPPPAAAAGSALSSESSPTAPSLHTDYLAQNTEMRAMYLFIVSWRVQNQAVSPPADQRRSEPLPPHTAPPRPTEGRRSDSTPLPPKPRMLPPFQARRLP